MIKKIILIILFFVTTAIADSNAKHILLLHSYNKSMTWEINIDKAVVDILQPSKNGYILHTEYMDTKRVFTNEYVEELKRIYSIKYKDVKFDIILSSDNNAFNFLRKNRDKLFGNVPTIFCGVNFFKDSDLNGLSNYTGVAENFDAKKTVKTALKLLPKTKKVYIINDYLTTGRAWEKTIKEQLKEYKNIEISHNKNLSMEQLQQKVHTLDKDSIVLLGVYFKDKNGKYFTYEKVGTLISSSSDVPVFCLLKFNIKGDVIGGEVIGGYYQGKAMATIAKRVLSGTKVSLIPVMKNGATKGVYNYKGLKKYNIEFDNVIKNGIIINKPTFFYETYRISILIGLFLTLVIILLFILNYKRKFAQKELLLIKKNLEVTVEERTKELEEKTVYLNRFYNNKGIGILLVDKNRVVKDINTKLAQMWGYTREEMLGQNAQFFHVSEKSYKKFGQIAFEQARQNKPISVAYQFKRKDGVLFWAKFSGEPINESDVLWIVTDINELKEKEQALIVLKEKAEEATKLKSEFLANMSHEIRTPMNGIIGMTCLTLQTTLNEKQKHYVNQIDNSAKNLLNIINDILDFSKIEAGKLTIEKKSFSMKILLDDIKSFSRIKAEEKGLKFSLQHKCSENNICYGDSARIRQILINLIGNSIKFTNHGFIKVLISRINTNKVKFEVIDSGIGISQNHQNKLFESFSQADGTITRKYGGTGLGLSISKQLVELMNGTIWVESEVDVGSKFIFEIELQEGNMSEVENQNNLDINIDSLKGSCVLLVEDNETNQEIIIGLLEHSGVKIDIANNGKEAVDMFKSNLDKYELILMDLQMPILDGFQATKIIRKMNKNIPIIALTANAMREDVQRTKAAGMNEHLNKPIEVEKLYATLLKYISKKSDVLENTIEMEEVELPKFQYIDAEKGLKHLAGNRRLYLKILNTFKSDYSEFNIDTLDEVDFKRATHTLKGLSANIGAISLYTKVKELDETQDKSLLNGVYDELKKVMKDLELLDKHNSKEYVKLLELTAQKREELLKQLIEFISRNRANGCKSTLVEIQKYKLNDEDKLVFNRVKEFINKYKYRDALLILGEIKW